MSRFRWAFGLVPLGALFAASVAIETPKVEEKVRLAAVAAAGSPGTSARVEGRDVVSLTAAGVDAQSAQKLRTAVANAVGIRRVNEKIDASPAPTVPAAVSAAAPAVVAAPVAPVLPPVLPAPLAAVEPVAPPSPPKPALAVADPFRLSVERTAAGFSTSGFAPSEDDRQTFLTALRTAAGPGGVTGALELATGLPSSVDYQTAASFLAVQASRLATGRAEINADMLSISGETPDEGGLAALRAATSGVLPGGLKLARLDVRAAPPPPPPVMKPFVFAATRNADGVTLSGAAPSGEARTSLLEAARLAGAPVVDQLSVRSGEPSGFEAMAAHGLAQLGRMVRGRFSLTDNVYALEGDAPDFAAQDAVQGALGALPQGAVAGAMNLNPPVIKPFGFSLVREAGGIILRGVFPDEASRQQAIEKLRTLYPGVDVRTDARIARGAPEGFGAIVNAAIEAFSKLSSGGVAFTGDALSLSGASASTLANLTQALSGLLPQGLRLDVGALQAAPEPPPAPVPAPVVAPAPAPVTPAPPARPAPVASVPAATPASPAPSCAADSSGVIARADIYFDSGKSRPKAEAAADLANIVRILMQCPDARTLAAGHTDGAGNRAPNLRLSTLRARSVARMLISAGAPPSRVATTSFAWDRPAASPEASDADRARNRRVEVLVRTGRN